MFIVIVCCSHFSVTRNPVMWRVVGHLQDFVNGTSYYVWVYQVRFTAKAFNLSFAPLQQVAHRGDLVSNEGNISGKQTLSTIELQLQRQ